MPQFECFALVRVVNSTHKSTLLSGFHLLVDKSDVGPVHPNLLPHKQRSFPHKSEAPPQGHHFCEYIYHCGSSLLIPQSRNIESLDYNHRYHVSS